MIQSEIRLCPIHGETVFHYYEKSGRRKGKGQWKCSKCESELAILNKQKYKLKMVRYKGGKCEKCGYKDNIAALEFHHLDPSKKKFNLSETRHSWEETKLELDKCICLCSNCHKEIHNPQSTLENLESLIKSHNDSVQLKKTISRTINKRSKYKFTLEEVLKKKEELETWKKVAEYYNISLSTLKRHKKELEESGQGG